tara:strand:- start:3035 stop:4399 length:1365 start_codon:yes stop_codon:yes gene_type:complete
MHLNPVADAVNVSLNIPQFEFYSMDKQFRAFVGGYRSGKTYLGCVRLCILALSYPGIKLGYFAPTYPQIRDIFYSTIADVAELFGMSVSIKVSTNEVTLSYFGDVHAVVKCRSMEHPSRIVGFDINHALIDEIDTMKKEKADQAWKKIIARLSSSGFDEQRLYDEELNADLVIEALENNTVDFTTTPEGFGWVYDLFVKQLRGDEDLQRYYGIVHASTKQNAKNLAKGYIDTLYATYPPNLVDAYIDGKFTNLTSGTVYTCFDRKLNNTMRTARDNDHLHIGMDFNVGKMSAIVHVEDFNGNIKITSAVDEFLGLLDTPAMIEAIQNRYPKHRITIYPDASGKNRKSVNASETDISLLRAAFNVNNYTRNPFVKDRVASVQAMLCNANELRRYFINEVKCPETCDSLEQQVYNKQGEPDKTHDNDHPNDALGYYIHSEFGIDNSNTTTSTRMVV